MNLKNEVFLVAVRIFSASVVTVIYGLVSWLVGDFANDHFELEITNVLAKGFTGAGIGFTCLYFYILVTYLFEE